MADCADENSNCTVAPDPDDGGPAQCVGIWASDKHQYLRKYIEATRNVRGDYDGSRPRDERPTGGTSYIDLFAGPGRARVRETKRFIDGSPLVAVNTTRNPFTDVILCELNHVNAEALRKRTAGRATVIEGDCNRDIDAIVDRIPTHGYNFALIDPYAPSALRFETLRRLAAFKRMDLLIHFPTGSMKRNFEWVKSYEPLVGLPYEDWGVQVAQPVDIATKNTDLDGQMKLI